MVDNKKKEEARRLVNSTRGYLLISRSIQIAIDKLNEVDYPLREDSDIADLQFLRDYIFDFPVEVINIDSVVDDEDVLIDRFFQRSIQNERN